MKTLLATSIAALLLTAGSSFAAIVNVEFSWSQTDPDPTTGSGTLMVTAQGIDFSAPMPTPTYNQKDNLGAGETLPTGVVGFANTVDSVQPGSLNGFHLGWSGTVNLLGSLLGVDYTFPVNLTYEEGDTWAYTADIFDDPAGIDVIGSNRFAGWIGDDGFGHRHSHGDDDFVARLDNFALDRGPNNRSIGDNAFGDNVGITMALRGGTDGSIFVSNLVFGGTLQQDDSGVIPEPSGALLMLVGCAGLALRRRRQR